MKPKVLILGGVGINSDRELAHAFELAGAEAVRVHLSDIEARPALVFDYQVLAFPGGFSYGDHIASGKILANTLRYALGEHLPTLVEKRVPMIGICNGFQVLVKLGLLPHLDGKIRQEVSLIHNDSGRYEDRWVELGVEARAAATSPWLAGLKNLRCPVRHGEGKLVCRDDVELQRLEESGTIALRYKKNGHATSEYPHNPNGSWNAIAGLIDPGGMIFGLMPHPEVATDSLMDGASDLEDRRSGKTSDCLRLFQNIVRYLKSH